MPRVKRGTIHQSKRSRMRRKARGHLGRGSTTFRLGKQVTLKAQQHAYRHRRTKKRVMRRLWITRLNAALRTHDLSYSRFVDTLKKQDVALDRKVLSQLAAEEPAVFEKVLETLKK